MPILKNFCVSHALAEVWSCLLGQISSESPDSLMDSESVAFGQRLDTNAQLSANSLYLI